MKHVFISYSRSDNDVVKLIEHDLISQGHNLWRDENDLRGGEEWVKKIEQAIIDSYALVVIFSSKSIESEWIEKEINIALEQPRDIPIIPVVLENIDLPDSLKKWQIVDFSEVEKAGGPSQILEYRKSIDRLRCSLEEVRPILRYLKELKHPNEDKRENAARMLGLLGDPMAAEALIVALSDPDEDVRFEATRALGKLESKIAYKHLVRLLRKKNPDICAAAANALGKIGLTHAIGPLLRLLDHQDRFVRENAISSLGKLGELGAVEPLIYLMRNDSISDVREAATKALKAIGGPVAERAIRRKQAMMRL